MGVLTVALVEDWHRAWRWFSVQSMAASAVLLGAWEGLPDELRQRLPHGLPHALAIVLLVLGIFGRLVKQGGPR